MKKSIKVCQVCGAIFEGTGNVRFCCSECRKAGDREARERQAESAKKRLRLKKESEFRTVPDISLADMLKAAEALTKKAGRTVSYGMLCQEMQLGNITTEEVKEMAK